MLFLNRKINTLYKRYPFLCIETFSIISKGYKTHAARLIGEPKITNYPTYDVVHWSYSYKSINDALKKAIKLFLQEQNGTL